MKGGVTDGQVDDLLSGFTALPAAIPQIRSYDFGRDAGLSPNPFGVVLVATFDSVQDFAAYREHPAHTALRRGLLVPIAEEITTTQFISG